MKHILEKLVDSYKLQVNTFKVHRDMMNTMIDNEQYLHIRQELMELEQMFKQQLSVKIVRPKILEILEIL